MIFEYMNVPLIDPIGDPPSADKPREYHVVHREFEIALYQLTMVEMGLAHARAGLVYFPPLCHDGYDY